MGLTVKHEGSFDHLEKFLKGYDKDRLTNILEQYGEIGVIALAEATPVDSGKTALAWGYKVEVHRTSFGITWTNSNVNDGASVAILLQYGHGTKGGGYVQGRDYINPAIQPIFDKISKAIWEEVQNL